MYSVNPDFNAKMKEGTRRLYARVEIDYTDPFIDQSIEIETSENANTSYPEQVADSIEETFGKIASLDGSWELDGTYQLAPTSEEAEEYQMGWWGSQLSDSSADFAEPYPSLSISFAPRPIRGLRVIADHFRQEYPVDFDIILYSYGTIIQTESITENSQIEWSQAIEPVNEITRLELVIKKWSEASRQVKIIEFFTSIQEVYESDEIMLINLLEEREVSQGSLPIGNISSNEIDIRLVNENGKFDAGNADSPLYQLLKQNRRIKAYIGTEINGEIEWVPLGLFYSGDWIAPEDSIYAQVTARDILESLRVSDYSARTIIEEDLEPFVYKESTAQELSKGELDNLEVV